MTPLDLLAHGVGGRADLPLPLWLFSYGAGAVLVVSFVALRVLWRRPRLAEAADGVALPGVLQRLVPVVVVAGRLLGVVVLAVVLAAAWLGEDSAGDNLAPLAVYVVFWVGVQAASALLGDVWRVLDPVDTVAAVGQRAWRWAMHDGDPDGSDDDDTRHRARGDPAQWTAAALLLSFVWLELAYHASGSPRAIAVWLILYLTVTFAGAAWWGRGWLRHGEGFAALFTMLAHLAPFHRDEDGRPRIRPPFTALSELPVLRGTGAVVLVVLGSTTFDGLSRTEWWLGVIGNRAGWGLTAVNTLGLLWVIAVMAAAYLLATWVMAWAVDRDHGEMSTTFLPSLVPIVLAYTLAHYFSLLVLEGQGVLALVSDPLGRGWDLFGTAARAVDFTVLSTDTIAYVQAGAIVVGHVVGVVAAHDRAVSLFPPRRAELSQYPMLGVMVLYTVGGLALLLGG